MGKGSQTTSTATSNAADPQAAQTYRDLLTRAQGVASTPYQAYTGELTAPVNSQQMTGISGINSNANFASPYIQQAAGQATSSSAPLTGDQIQNYVNPYTQNVVDATTQQLQHDNSQQMAQLQGNQISQGALGGNATGVAKGILAGQQGRTLASTTAGLYQQGYQQALQAAQQQQQLGLSGANAIANYGISGQGAALSGAGQQINAGGLLQQTQQQADTANYGQYAQGQAFPYQQTQWLAGIGTGVGSNLGGTSAGSTTGPAPNQTAQWIGAGLSGAALLSDRRAKDNIEHIGKMNDGTPIYRFRYKDSSEWHVGPMAQDVERRNPDAVERGLGGLRYIDLKAATDDSVRSRAEGGGVGGVPWGGAQGWIPTMAIHGGSGAPSAHAPSAPSTPAFDPSKFSSGISGLKNANLSGQIGQFFNPDSYGNGNAVYGGSSDSPLAGLSAADYGEGFARGGSVAGYATGGGPGFDDLTNGDPAWEEPGVGPGYPRRDPRVRGDVMNGDPAWERPDVGPGTVANFDERFGKLPAAQKNQEFQDAYFAANGADPRAFASAGPPLPQARPTGAGAPVVASDDDEEASPTGIAGRSGAAPQGGVMAFAPSGPGSYGNMPDAISRPQDERSGLGLLPISKNAGTGLLTAGLGMLASRSPFLGNAIGEGGLAGVSAYGSAEQNDQRVAAEAAKLSREARKQFVDESMGNRKQTETERHNKATESKEALQRIPTGMRLNKSGELENIPGFVKSKQDQVKAGMVGSTMDDDTAEFLADRVAMGDTKALVGLGRGAQGAENLSKINSIVARKAREGSPVSDAARTILQNAAQQQGLIAAERTQANIMAKLSVYGRTAFNATDIAEKLSDEVPRTQFMPVNKILNAARTNTGDPKIVALGQGLMTLTNEYARAIGGGHGTVHDKEEAEKRLSAAQTHEQLKAVIDVMRKEILAEERAMPAARKHIRDIYNPTSGGPRGSSIAGEHGAASPPGPVSGASGFPADAIPRQFNGKTYYYDPNTKQPYPGQ